MATNSVTSRAASVLPAVGILLVLGNWYAKPAAALAWLAALAMLIVMAVALSRARRGFRQSAGDATARRSLDSITSAVAFAALMMIVPMTATLGDAFGLVDDRDVAERGFMIILGIYLGVMGNAMPRMLPPLASMACDGARIQAFQRFAGWTWVLCGLGFTTAWLVLPSDYATPVSMTLVVAAMVVTIVQALRLRFGKPRPDRPAHSVN